MVCLCGVLQTGDLQDGCDCETTDDDVDVVDVVDDDDDRDDETMTRWD